MPDQEDYIVEAAQEGGLGLSLTEKRQAKRDRVFLYVALVLILLINFVVLFCVRRRMKQEVNRQMNNQVQSTVQQDRKSVV